MPICRIPGELWSAFPKHSLDIISSVMLWPDDEEQRQSGVTASALEILPSLVKAGLPLSPETLAGMMEAARDARSMQQVRADLTSRLLDGRLTGLTLIEMIVPRRDTAQVAKTIPEAQGRALSMLAEHFRDHGRSIAERSAEAIWQRMRPVAHLWAAHLVWAGSTESPAFPCDVKGIEDFLSLAAVLFEDGADLKAPRATGHVLDCNLAWQIAIQPTGPISN